MPLKFPNVRLFLFDLLTCGGLTGPEAIATTACEYGIIPLDCMNEVIAQIGQVDGCLCVATLKNVLRKHFAVRAQQSGLPEVDADSVWNAIETDARKHQKLASLQDSNYNCPPDSKTSNCLISSPALFDFLLQHIRRYP